MNEFKDILVAIHGIGEQSRNTTVRSVATRLAHSSASIVQPGEVPPVAPQPLGWFHSDVKDVVKVVPLDSLVSPSYSLAQVGFTEVFWADIPQEVVEEGRTMEETKAWARTVVARARAVYKRNVYRQATDNAGKISTLPLRAYTEPDFSLAAEVLDEMIETIQVLQNLMFLAEKAGILKFDLDEVLQEYLGDVQIVTEFGIFRRDIVGRFHRAMKQIHDENPKANLHVVAHSEGTVVSFLGLLEALSGRRIVPVSDPQAPENDDPKKDVPEWLANLKGYLTIGSPIDKHILLWPDLFREFDFTPARALFANGPRIKWRNYYDYGDPVGFALDTAREFLAMHAGECQPFEFESKHDIGFARYLLPGKAHNDYWDDPAVFEHYMMDVVKGAGDAAPKPKTIPRVYWLSPTIPYVLAFGILLIGTWLLYRGVTTYMHPGLDPLQRYVRYNVLGLAENKSASSMLIGFNSLAIAGFIAGITLFARLPRLAAGLKWYAWGLIAFMLGCWSYQGVALQSRIEIGKAFGPTAHTVGIFALGFIVVVFALWGTKKPSHEFGKPQPGDVPRNKRWVFRGMRLLLATGAAAVAVVVVGQILPHSALTPAERAQLSKASNDFIDQAHLNREELNMLLWGRGSGSLMNSDEKNIRETTRLLSVHPPAWPLLLSGAIFLYLWWLAALIFDLAFVWQRYVRQAAANEHLRQWHQLPNFEPSGNLGTA